VGAGGMGGTNAQALGAENIVAVCDVDFDLVMEKVAEASGDDAEEHAKVERWQQQFASAARYNDFREMLDTERGIDAVLIATPDHTHAVIAKAAMELGKHVYVQKPMTATVAESRMLARLAEETGVAGTADPFGGSYFLENLTDEMEAAMESLIDAVEAEGGMVSCIERGLIQRWISESAYKTQKEIDSGERVVIGVNKHAGEAAESQAIFSVSPHLAEQQLERLKKIKAGRDPARVEAALARLGEAARGTANLMEPIGEAVDSYATVGEISNVLRGVFGEFQEPAGF
ncbi:MAG TPA: hypothetical protein EYQ64_10185, partial [Gemmatimonadetes bacterium]|nr:hypothetical protein [Gemmatimonadota bacterium]